MTAERVAEIEFEAHPEELALLLAAPMQTDSRRITDPIALYGTRSPDQLSAALVASPVPMPA